MNASFSLAETTPEELERIIAAAAVASANTPAERRELLHTVAAALDDHADELIPIAQQESHLPEARLRSEVARTTFQLRLLGDEAVRAVEAVVDTEDPAWPAGGRPDIRRMLVPVGPVVVFAASNFPFAFSVAGGDTAAALAVGAPVIVKAHPGHPQLSRRTAEIVSQCVPEGMFALIHGVEAGVAALRDSRIAAGAFTGSTAGGRLLANIAASRPHPIPFHAELGSTNPVFVTPAAAAARGTQIATGYVESFLLGAGQFCTKPGLLLVPTEAAADMIDAAAQAVLAKGAAPLLNTHIEEGHARSRAALQGHPQVTEIVAGTGIEPALLATTAAAFLAEPEILGAECFGPTSVVVRYGDAAQIRRVAAAFEGELTATVHGEESADDLAAELIMLSARFAGRVLWNGWPTGVAVTHAMQHGGPYPASTSQFTSVGTSSLRRFQRPVAYQNVPDALLPAELRAANPLAIPRREQQQ
ncbi:aldehyde dehydrogenase (NADP(+)) [Nocardia neocaledoniensis]|uniref:aldehyde dehydrogenase (NADP(+)) n=1 Tax=Nocardia neocaledoniensis TaxID=236511 RepID=UPI0024575CFA|nr:aldehyde dehydrogenase (NADP(+)) [Nocardia neocaledoniensis]